MPGEGRSFWTPTTSRGRPPPPDGLLTPKINLRALFSSRKLRSLWSISAGTWTTSVKTLVSFEGRFVPTKSCQGFPEVSHKLPLNWNVSAARCAFGEYPRGRATHLRFFSASSCENIRALQLPSIFEGRGDKNLQKSSKIRG